MKIKMLTDAPGSTDGIHVHQYEAGTEHDVPDELGEVLVREDLAERADTPARKPKPKASKDAGAQPENKAG